MIKSLESENKTRIVIRCGNMVLMDITSNCGISGGIDIDEIKSIRTYNDRNISVLEIEVYEYAKVQRYKPS